MQSKGKEAFLDARTDWVAKANAMLPAEFSGLFDGEPNPQLQVRKRVREGETRGSKRANAWRQIKRARGGWKRVASTPCVATRYAAQLDSVSTHP